MTTRLLLAVIAIAACAGLGAAAVRSYNQAQAEATKQKTRADAWATYHAAEHKARLTERAQYEQTQKVQDEAHTKTKALTVATRTADRVAVSLQQHTAQLAAQCRAPEAAAPAASGVATPSPGAVLAELHRRADEAAGMFARYADELRISAEACVAIYPVKE